MATKTTPPPLRPSRRPASGMKRPQVSSVAAFAESTREMTSGVLRRHLRRMRCPFDSEHVSRAETPGESLPREWTTRRDHALPERMRLMREAGTFDRVATTRRPLSYCPWRPKVAWVVLAVAASFAVGTGLAEIRKRMLGQGLGVSGTSASPWQHIAPAPNPVPKATSRQPALAVERKPEARSVPRARRSRGESPLDRTP